MPNKNNSLANKNKGKKSNKSSKKTNNSSPPKVKIKTSGNEFFIPKPEVITNRKLFPVTAIGASAGGIEAFGNLLKTLSPGTGMAFVFILHLSPDHKSNLPEIISRQTNIPFKQIVAGEMPEPDTIYAIEPNTYITLEDGKFCINERGKNNKAFMPIDVFMKSLAECNKHYAIGVLLSGTDSDGVKGLEYIKTNSGITLVQDPVTAKFPDIPQNAISAGVVDYVLPAEEIGEELNLIGNNLEKSFKKIGVSDEILPSVSHDLNIIFQLMKYNFGVDFSDYKPATIKRRILRRIVVNKLSKIDDYINLLKSNPVELKMLYDDLLINVTSFFRDPNVYEAIRKKVLPQIFEKRNPDNPVRIWITACSTGEEAYSMAMTILDFLGTKAPMYQIQIFATDLSDIGIEIARSGIYSKDIKKYISPQRLKKYFFQFNGKYRIIKSIRDMCVFAKQNLVQDPPFSKLDLISCRNVLIYFGQILQNKVLHTFHYSLKPDGFLILGTSETIGHFSGLFISVDKKNKIYRKKVTNEKFTLDFKSNNYSTLSPGVKLPVRVNEKIIHVNNILKEADSIIASQYVPAYVLINNDLDILQFHGLTGFYLNLPEGTASYNLYKMAKEGLDLELSIMLRKAQQQNVTVKKENVKYSFNGSEKEVNLTVIPMPGTDNTGDNRLFIVVFEDTKNSKMLKFNENGKSKKIQSKQDINLSNVLKEELSKTKERLQAIIEQHETTNQVLKVANEEIQSSNEELQSTNEELETAKEELQSTNEELQTVNDELNNRNSELVNVNNDLVNLLSSTHIPIVMVDNKLRIRRYTSVSENMLNIIPSDIGRKITDINIGFNIPEFEKMLNNVIDTLRILDMDVKDKNDDWYSIRVRPYKTLDNRIDGVIIAFIEISELRRSINKLHDAQKMIKEVNREFTSRDREMAKKYERSNESLEAQIIESKNAEETLRILSRHLVDAQEGERMKIARDLHDSVNQMLTAVKMKIHSTESALKNKEIKKEVVAKDVREAKELLNETISEIRRISMNLRPGTLDELGIDVALKSLIDEFHERNDIYVSSKIDFMNNKITKDIQLVLFRIMQETLQNIEKHAKSNRVYISIKYTNMSVRMMVKDNGKGFNLEKIRAKKTFKNKFGLLSMKERAEAIGGKFEIASVPSVGTKVTVFIPIYKKSKVSKNERKQRKS